jgi:putative FmdB family regulatory protein
VPAYDYQCRSCGVISEVVHSMLEDGPTKCERCGGQLRRLVHPTGIIFKGSGFYKTDSRSSSSGSVSGGSRTTTPQSTETSASTGSTDAGAPSKGTESSSSGADPKKGSSGGD